jgi:hypothetical protein
MACRSRRFMKEKINLPYTIKENETYTHMEVMPYLTITLLDTYPFSPPKLYINKVDYINYLLKKYNHLKPFIDKYKINTPCICCDSVTCSWSPCYGVKDIVHECVSYLKKMRMFHDCKRVFETLLFDDLVYCKIVNYL